MSATPHLRRRRRVAAVLAAVAATLVAPALPVLAHGGVLPQPIIDSVPGGLDGLEARGVVRYGPRVSVTNPDTEPLTVVDDAGRGWLQISADGVFADLSVRAWYESIDASGRGVDPPADAPTGWTKLSELPTWEWSDSDLLAAGDGSGEHEWSIPVAIGGSFDEITGTLRESDLQGAWVTRLLESGDVGAARLSASSGSVPVFVVQRLDAEEVVVLGPYGEPMVRLTAAGFEANLASPGWTGHARLDRASTFGVAVEDPDPNAPPVWEMQLEGAPTAVWIELRGDTGSVVPRKRSEAVMPFQVPVVVDGERFDVAAETVWQGDEPPILPIRLTVPVLVALSVGAGLLAAGTVQVFDRRRAARDAAPTTDPAEDVADDDATDDVAADEGDDDDEQPEA